jgi:hypothetical protein
MQLFLLNLEVIFRSWKKNVVENFAHLEKWHLSNISWFSTGRKHLLRRKRRFSWSATQTLSNDVKKQGIKIFTWSLRCGHLTWKQIYWFIHLPRSYCTRVTPEGAQSKILELDKIRHVPRLKIRWQRWKVLSSKNPRDSTRLLLRTA